VNVHVSNNDGRDAFGCVTLKLLIQTVDGLDFPLLRPPVPHSEEDRATICMYHMPAALVFVRVANVYYRELEAIECEERYSTSIPSLAFSAVEPRDEMVTGQGYRIDRSI
jgi:hypothetical protein